METRAFYYLASEGTHLSVTLCQTILTFLQRSHKVQNDICSNGRPYIFTFVSPPKNDSFRKDSCFSPDVFFLLATRDLRDVWADRREILQDGQY